MQRCLAAIAAFVIFGVLPAAVAAETMNILVNKSHIVRLSRDAGVVMIANPEIADVAIESPRLVFVLGRNPGETNLKILDVGGKSMVSADVIVRPNAERHVTVNRGSEEITYSCVPRCARVETPWVDGGGSTGSGSSAKGGNS